MKLVLHLIYSCHQNVLCPIYLLDSASRGRRWGASQRTLGAEKKDSVNLDNDADNQVLDFERSQDEMLHR